MTGCKGFKAGLDAHKKTLMCGLGVPVGYRMKHGKRQGVPVGCRMKHGKRQAWTPMTGCKRFKPFDVFLRVLRVQGLANGRLGRP